MAATGCHGPPSKTSLRMAESKERIKGMRNMLKENVAFHHIENFLRNSAAMGRCSTEQGVEERHVIEILMRKKLQDVRRNLERLRKEEKNYREKLRKTYGKSNKGYKQEIKKRNNEEKQRRQEMAGK